MTVAIAATLWEPIILSRRLIESPARSGPRLSHQSEGQDEERHAEERWSRGGRNRGNRDPGVYQRQVSALARGIAQNSIIPCQAGNQAKDAGGRHIQHCTAARAISGPQKCTGTTDFCPPFAERRGSAIGKIDNGRRGKRFEVGQVERDRPFQLACPFNSWADEREECSRAGKFHTCCIRRSPSRRFCDRCTDRHPSCQYAAQARASQRDLIAKRA